MYAAAGNPRRTQSSGKKTIYGWTLVNNGRVIPISLRNLGRSGDIFHHGYFKALLK